MTFDSVWQFNEAVSGHYMDHHPPLMAWTWSFVNRVVPGPLGMLLLHVAMMWSALLLIADGAARRGIRHAWIVIAIGFLPPVIGIEGEIWKDVGMAAALLFATALVYRASAGRERIGAIVAALALVPLFYATAVRANAPAAVAPILVYWARCAFPRTSWRASVLTGATALALLLGIQWIVDNKVIEARHAYVSQYLAAHDLVALRCGGAHVSIPAKLERVTPGTRPLCEMFDPLVLDFLFVGNTAPLMASSDPEVVRALWHEWRRAILANPLRYVAHRARMFNALLGFGVDDARRFYWLPESIPNSHGFTFVPNAFTHVIGSGVVVAHALGLYNGALWLAIACFVLVVVGVRTRRDERSDAVAIALAVSALAYTLPYFLVAPSVDYRYLYWTVIASALAAVLTLLRPLSR
ncbi:MAG: hypothetical protein ABI881_12465 [Betaproteobacteria bacterium]